ncbi:MAG: hypothetical protein K2L48_02200 [Mycoplasmoidaceae bacterium]|nr:hypothetical protein [Mycoplasmoidaceae bacterium]
MNTTKVGTQRVNAMSTQKAKNGFQNFYYLFAYLYAIVMMGVVLGCLFINDNHYCGFHKRAADGTTVTTSFPG